MKVGMIICTDGKASSNGIETYDASAIIVADYVRWVFIGHRNAFAANDIILQLLNGLFACSPFHGVVLDGFMLLACEFIHGFLFEWRYRFPTERIDWLAFSTQRNCETQILIWAEQESLWTRSKSPFLLCIKISDAFYQAQSWKTENTVFRYKKG